MRDRKLRAFLPAALCLIAAHQAWGDTMRCGNGIVEVGNSMATVQALCGPPTLVQQGVKESATTVGGGHGSESHTVGAAVPVETWTYNRGPNQLLVNIRFVNGQVVAIETLHQYGN
jgi:Protein of unknown function (DUF2845)